MLDGAGRVRGSCSGNGVPDEDKQADDTCADADLFEVPSEEKQGDDACADADLFEVLVDVFQGAAEADLFEAPPPPHVDAVGAPLSEPSDPDMFERPLGDGVHAAATVDLRALLQTPPMHHINDTVAKGLGGVMPSFDKTTHSAKLLCQLVRSRGHRCRMLQTCFASTIGVQY